MEHHKTSQSSQPIYGKPSDLSQPKQRDLTPEEADRVLKPPRRSRREERPSDQDPVEKGRSGLEMLIYGLMLIAVVGYQLFAWFESDDGRSPFEQPRVVAIEVDDLHQDERYTVDGNRLEKPDCEAGEAEIQTAIATVDGNTLGQIRISADPDNGSWEISARALLGGGARITVDATIDCPDGNTEND